MNNRMKHFRFSDLFSLYLFKMYTHANTIGMLNDATITVLLKKEKDPEEVSSRPISFLTCDPKKLCPTGFGL